MFVQLPAPCGRRLGRCRRALTFVTLTLLLLSLAAHARPARAQPAPPTLSISPGWNLLGSEAAFPPDVLAQADAPFYEWIGNRYLELPTVTDLRNNQPRGFWAHFSRSLTVTLHDPDIASWDVSFQGGWVVVGSTFLVPAAITGADAMYTFDPVTNAWSAPVTQLQPGQGAFAYCASSCTVGSTIPEQPGATARSVITAYLREPLCRGKV